MSRQNPPGQAPLTYGISTDARLQDELVIIRAIVGKGGYRSRADLDRVLGATERAIALLRSGAVV